MQQANSQLIGDICELLTNGIGEVFNTMFNSRVDPVAVPDFSESEEQLVAGCVGFVGDANGVVYIYLADGFARALAVTMLQMTEDELDDSMVNDVVAEITNMVVGSAKSNLCDRGLNCVLTIPSIVRGREFCAEASAGAERALLGFRSEQGTFLVEVIARSQP